MPEVVLARMVKVPHDGTKLPAYFARPRGRGKRPGLVIVPQEGRLDPRTKEVCRQFAGEGYLVVAPDLAWGGLPARAEEGIDAWTAREKAVREVISCVTYLRRQGACTSRVGVVGFGLGGGLALLTALRGSGVQACVAVSGAAPDPPDQVKHLECPFLGLYAGRDTRVAPDAVRALEGKLREYGKAFQVHIYPGADHAFFDDAGPGYHPEAARDAWDRAREFLARHLK